MGYFTTREWRELKALITESGIWGARFVVSRGSLTMSKSWGWRDSPSWIVAPSWPVAGHERLGASKRPAGMNFHCGVRRLMVIAWPSLATQGRCWLLRPISWSSMLRESGAAPWGSLALMRAAAEPKRSMRLSSVSRGWASGAICAGQLTMSGTRVPPS